MNKRKRTIENQRIFSLEELVYSRKQKREETSAAVKYTLLLIFMVITSIIIGYMSINIKFDIQDYERNNFGHQGYQYIYVP